MKLINELGSPNTYEHYPTGWAVAFSTPFKMFKRYSYAGGTCDPLVISWPAGIAARGEVRSQYHHSTDIVPTILDCCGLTFPETLNGVDQVPLPGVSMRYSFDDANASTQKRIQYYAMLGTRGIWQDGWKAVTVHGPTSDLGHFDKDVWELYNVEADRSEAQNIAQENPDKLKNMIELWFSEAGRYNVLPLDDRHPEEILTDPRPQPEPPRDTYIYYPGASEVPEAIAVSVRGRSYKLLANVDIESADARGILFAHGARFGGHSLFIKDRKLWYVYNFLGIPPEQQLISSREITSGKHTFGMEFVKESTGEHGETLGKARLYIDEEQVAEAPLHTQPGTFTLCGDGLCVGRDSSDPVSKEYGPGFAFEGGTIQGVAISVGNDIYMNLEKEAAAALARD
jgi:arylsulfatase